MPHDVRALIREMSTANPLWGAPRIHGELQKLGISVSQSTVAKYMRRHPRPPSQTWRTFLANHAGQIMAADFFVVPTVTCRLLFVFVILAHDRRRVVHVAVTAHPTAAWTAQQLRNAFSENEAPRYLLHDRDSVFADVATTIAGMNTRRFDGAAIPWQNAYVERVIGSIRRECLDHVIVVNAAGLHRVFEPTSRTTCARERISRSPRTRRARGRSRRRQPAHRRHSRSRRSAPPLRPHRRVAGGAPLTRQAPHCTFRRPILLLIDRRPVNVRRSVHGWGAVGQCQPSLITQRIDQDSTRINSR